MPRALACSGIIAVLAVELAGGCGDAGSEAPRDAGPASSVAGRDEDGDGLCDAVESAIGTDPAAADTDGDRVPDGIEIGYGFDAADPSMPSADRLAYLDARRGAAIDFPVRVTVDVEGADFTGAFSEEESLYDDGTRAAAFFQGAQAVSAMPFENARALREEAFVGVTGRTRLEFVLHFQHPASDPVECARAYPFRYTVKSSQGETVSASLRLLVVAPGAAMAADDWCVAGPCANE